MATLQIDTVGHSASELKLIHSILQGTRLLIESELRKVREAHAAEVDVLKRRIVALEEKNDDLECYGRRNTLVISGKAMPSAAEHEDSYNIVVDLVSQNSGISIARDDIDVCHRLGKPRKDGPDKRSIIVKFVRRETKHKILKACSIKKPKDIYFNDSVSRTRSTILYVLRKAHHDYPDKIGKSSTRDGNVRVMLPSAGTQDLSTRMMVNTRRELDALLLTRLNATSSKFDARW